MLLSNIWVLQNYLPKPLCVLVEGTAPCRNSCLELSRMSWSPAMMETPSLHSLVIGAYLLTSRPLKICILIEVQMILG